MGRRILAGTGMQMSTHGHRTARDRLHVASYTQGAGCTYATTYGLSLHLLISHELVRRHQGEFGAASVGCQSVHVRSAS